MKEKIFTCEIGGELIVRHRKSAVFFECIPLGLENTIYPELFSKIELERTYIFSDEAFKEFRDYCNKIANEAWTNFIPKEVDSWGAEYDDYYDKDFDNNGRLIIRKNELFIKGPYAQPKNNERIRLIKFNKRRFESFVYDLNKLMDGGE